MSIRVDPNLMKELEAFGLKEQLIGLGMNSDMRTASLMLIAKMLWKNPEHGIAFKEELNSSTPASSEAMLIHSFLSPLTFSQASKFAELDALTPPSSDPPNLSTTGANA